MITPEDLKYQYIEHLSAVTINTEVKKLHVKSPEFVKIENEENELMLELERLKFDIDSLKSMVGNDYISQFFYFTGCPPNLIFDRLPDEL